MGKAELLIGGLLVAIAGLGALARRLSIPYPIVLVIGGALFGFIPGLPEVKLDPNVVLVVFLPVLVYSAAFYANLADIRAEPAQDHAESRSASCSRRWPRWRSSPMCSSALPWAAAFALGAVSRQPTHSPPA